LGPESSLKFIVLLNRRATFKAHQRSLARKDLRHHCLTEFLQLRSQEVPTVGRDRLRKLQEVAILKVLSQSDHIVQLVDSWEEKNHLYMQTEFCEEGSLDLFLVQVRRKARLDDFCI